MNEVWKGAFMKLSVYLLALVLSSNIGCAQKAKHTASKCSGSSNGEHAVGKWDSCVEDSFMAAEDAKFASHKRALVKLGHMDKEFSDVAMVLGRYAWHGNGSGYFGAYSFYEPAFEQAKRGWFIHTGKVLEGSNELWVDSDTIHFDNSVIGYKLAGMNSSWMEDGKYKSEWFTAKIVAVKDDGRTLVLDKRAHHHAEQWHMHIVPDDWVDMCACTNNFSPQFSNGQPIVEPVTSK